MLARVALVAALALVPNCQAETLPPIVTAASVEGGTLVEWTLPEGAEPDAIVVQIYSETELMATVELPGDARQFLDTQGFSGLVSYHVTYRTGASQSLPGVAVPGYPHCWNIVHTAPSPPFVVVRIDCLLPPPIHE